MRVYDFFLTIYLTFYFQLLPFAYSTNEELEKKIINRNIGDRNFKLEDINASLMQVKYKIYNNKN